VIDSDTVAITPWDWQKMLKLKVETMRRYRAGSEITERPITSVEGL